MPRGDKRRSALAASFGRSRAWTASTTPSSTPLCRRTRRRCSTRPSGKRKARKNNEFDSLFVNTAFPFFYLFLFSQEFLIDQGYSFRVLSDLVPADDQSLAYSSADDQRQLLEICSQQSAKSGDIERFAEDFLLEARNRSRQEALARQTRGTLSAVALGGSDVVYAGGGGSGGGGGGGAAPRGLFGRPAAPVSRAIKPSHPLFKKIEKQMKEARKRPALLRTDTETRAIRDFKEAQWQAKRKQQAALRKEHVKTVAAVADVYRKQQQQ